jgi:type IV secretory pathway TraG/TraD family ATPase VirD4
MADGGGVGISVFAVFQSLAQARNEWGEQQATALFDASTVKVQLGGASNVQDLEQFARLAGQRKVLRSSSNRGRSWDSSSYSEQIHDTEVLRVDELRRLPFGWGLLLNRNGRPILMEMVKWPDRKDSKQIKEAIKEYSSTMADELENGLDALPSNASSADRADTDIMPVIPPPHINESSLNDVVVR